MIEQALLYLAGAFFGTLGFAVLTRVPRRTLLAAGGIAAVVYMVYWLLSLAGLSEHTAVFFGTTVGSLALPMRTVRSEKLAYLSATT